MTGEANDNNLNSYTAKDICAFGAALCSAVLSEMPRNVYKGGIYPTNLSEKNDKVIIGKASAQGEWKAEEIMFLAPEVFWEGKATPRSDVYSIGMLLYFFASGGKVPFYGEKDAQLSRLRGEKFPMPEGIDSRLSEIIEKAVTFSAEERYESVSELKIMLESCIDNPYTSDSGEGGNVFGKKESELSPVEKMMLNIMNRGAEQSPGAPSPDDDGSAGETADGEQPGALPAEETPAEAPAGEESASEDRYPEEMLPETDTPGSPDAAGAFPQQPDEEQQPDDEQPPEEAAAPVSEAPSADAKSETSGKEKRSGKEEKPKKEKKLKITYANAQTDRELEREKKIEARVRQKTRQFAVITSVLVVLLIAAAFIQQRFFPKSAGQNIESNIITVTPDPEQAVTLTPAPTAEPTPAPTLQQPYYELYLLDMSWDDAKLFCESKGGHLAVITSQEEFDKITDLALSAGVLNLWVGCSRTQIGLLWVSGEDVDFYPWYDGEPDGAGETAAENENYILLQYKDGSWTYIDTVDSPAAEYPDIYSGKLGFVCEYIS